MDLSFLRTLAASNLPRSVPPGPAFHAVLAYQAAGLLEVIIPPVVRTRSGSSIQHDAVVTSITDDGWAALRSDGAPAPWLGSRSSGSTSSDSRSATSVL